MQRWKARTAAGVIGDHRGSRLRSGNLHPSIQLVTGRVWKGSAFGSVKGRSQLPGMVEDAMKGDIDLEPFVTHTMSLDEINDAFDLMHEGKSIRTVIRY